jgi:EmrB/QacA subfamily drug resistance transporter
MQDTKNTPRFPAIVAREPRSSHAPFLVRGKLANPWLALVALCLLACTSMFDTKALHVALPSIQAALGVDLTTVSWVVNVASLVTAIFFIPVGRFADQYGRKRLLMYGVIIFGLGNLLCALSPTIAELTNTSAIYWLIGFRAVQAIGTTLHVIVLATIMALFPPGKRGLAIGVYIAWSGLMQMGSPLLGGVLVNQLGWTWLFLVGLPFSAIALVCVSCFVPETGDPHLARRADWPGIITLSIAMFSLVLSIQGGSWGWSVSSSLVLSVVALAALLFFVLIERRQSRPMIGLRLFRIPSFTVANLIACLDGLAMPGALLLMSYYLMNMLGYNQVQAGLILAVIPAASLVAAALAGVFSIRINVKVIGIVSLTTLALGLFLLSLLSLDASEIDIACCCVLIGASMGLMGQSLPAIVLSEVPRERLGASSGVFTTCGQLCAALGVPLLLSIFLAQVQTGVVTARAQATALVQADTVLPASTRDAIVTRLGSMTVNPEANVNVDLSTLTDLLPANTPTQAREVVTTDLNELSERINSIYRTQIVNAYHTVWIVASLTILTGGAMIGFILFKRHPRSDHGPGRSM